MICPECQTSNREAANFCRRCGHLLVDHCPRCHISLLPDSDYCDNCALPLTPAAALGWVSSDRLSQRGGYLARFDTIAETKEPLPVESRSPTGVEPQAHTPTTPRLDQFIPHELREKLNSARLQGEMVGERRIVTMLFCDVKGSTAAAENLDPEEWTEIINGAFELMIRPVYKYEGTVARLMGDGILAFFGAPLTHEDDPQRAVLAGLDIVNHISSYRGRIKQSWGIDINVRVGINTGLVVVGVVGSDLRMEYTAMGDAINLAARMEQTAEPGTVQIAHETYKLVKPLFEFEDLGGIHVKGKTDPVPAYKVVGRKAQAGRQRGIQGLHTTLVGREGELSALQDVLSALQQAVGHIVCLIGEAGLGKSRLIHEAKRLLENDQSLNWFETSSLSYEINQPYAPFQRLIRSLNNMSPSDSAEQVRQKLALFCNQFDEPDGQQALQVFEALFDLQSNGQAPLEGKSFKQELYDIMPALWRHLFSQQPTVLVFDDIHWSDPASVELLLHLLPLTAEIPLVLLCASRPERSGAVKQIRRTAHEYFRHLYTEIIMHLLTHDQANDLIDSLLLNTDMPLRLRMRILERAGGNPFFIEEVIRSLIDNQVLVAEEIEQDGQKAFYWQTKDDGQQIDIPTSLQSLLSSRIDRLEEQTKRILQTAAVIGRSFYRRVLEVIELRNGEAGQVIELQLNNLLSMEIIREAARLPEFEYQFSNPLTQEVAYQSILLKRRRQIHRRVGQTLEELFPDQLSELAPLLAYHFSEGEQKVKAFDYYIMSGDSAARLFANVEAVDHYSKALNFVGSVDPAFEKLEALYIRRGRALELLGRYEDSLANYEAMLKHALDQDNKRLALAAKMAQATIHSVPSRVFDAEISLQLSNDALDLALELGESPAEAKIHWNLLLYHLWASFDFEQAVTHGEAAATVARESDLTIELGPILNDLATAYVGVGRLADALQALEESRILLRDNNNLPLLALNLTNSATYQFLAGKNELAQNLMEEAEKINQSLENNWGSAGSNYYWGCMQLIFGNWGEALNDFNKAIEFSDKAQAEAMSATSKLGKASYKALIGATGTGITLCRQAMQFFDKNMLVFQGYPWGLMSLLYLGAGERKSAQDALQTSLATLDLDLPPTPTFASIEVRKAEIKFRLSEGNFDLAAKRADDFLDYLQRFQIKQFQSDAYLLKAKALLAADQPQEATSILLKAYHEAEDLSALPILWQILDAQADALQKIGNPDQAELKRDRARAILKIVADSIGDEEDRATFLNLPHIGRLLDSTP